MPHSAYQGRTMAIEFFNQKGMIQDLSELDRMRDVPRGCERFARVLADYDPTIFIRKLDPSHPQFNKDKPYSIVVNGSTDRYVLKNYAEWELDERIMADIISADVTQSGGSIDDVQALNAAHEFMKIKEREEMMAERREVAREVAKLGLTMNYARHNGKLLFDPNA
jgi:hypothetical protein